MTYDFSLDRKATVTLGAGSVLLLILVFVAGVLTGLTWRSDQELMAVRKPAAPIEKVAAGHQAEGGTQTTPGAATPPTTEKAVATAPAPAALPAPSAVAVPAVPAAAPAAAPASVGVAAAPATPAASPRSPDAPGVQLAIQVGAFLEKANADKLVERLKEEGYAPQVVLGGHAPKQWNFVRVGPYHDWEQASEIAAVLSRGQGTQAVIRPMR